MYNIKVAVSRLEFAPETREMEVTDIRTGHFIFPPLPEVPVSRSALERVITDAGYVVDDAALEVSGELLGEDRVRAERSGQTFQLVGPRLEELRDVRPGSPVNVQGRWRERDGAQILEVEAWTSGG